VVASALATVRHPGRFEILERPAAPAPAGIPRIILDGAHNPHGAAALADVLRARGERPVLIAAVSADKDVAAIAAALAPAMRAVVATRYQQERAMDPARLAAAFAAAPGAPSAIAAAPDLTAALAVAASHQAPIAIAGSLFLVGEARTLLLGAPTDPVRLSDPVAVPRR
jgi:dihydrofolate synthase/folylpolyglutamate synthase